MLLSNAYLRWFTSDHQQFPFFIQYGGHVEDMELHNHMDFTELVIVLNGHATHVVNTEEFFIKKETRLSSMVTPIMRIKTLMILGSVT